MTDSTSRPQSQLGVPPPPGSVPYGASSGVISTWAAGELLTARAALVKAAAGCLRLSGALEIEQLIAFGGEPLAAALLDLASAHDSGAFETIERAARGLAAAAGCRPEPPEEPEPDTVAFLSAVLILRTRLIMLDAATAGERAVSLITLGDSRRMIRIGREFSVQSGFLSDVRIILQVPALPPPPRQLPQPGPVTRPMVKAAIQAMHALLTEHKQGDAASCPLMLVVTGTAGAGASTAAAAFLHDVATAEDRIRAELYTDLQHATVEQPSGDPSRVLGRWLTDLGIPHDQMPPDETPERAAWIRSLTQDGPLVLIDGATSTTQALPLLPAGPSVVVITSRAALSGLVMHGAIPVPLTPEEK